MRPPIVQPAIVPKGLGNEPEGVGTRKNAATLDI